MRHIPGFLRRPRRGGLGPPSHGPGLITVIVGGTVIALALIFFLCTWKFPAS